MLNSKTSALGIIFPNSYDATISDHQTLLVTLEETHEGWEVISWRAVAYPAEAEDGLPVWKG